MPKQFNSQEAELQRIRRAQQDTLTRLELVLPGSGALMQLLGYRDGDLDLARRRFAKWVVAPYSIDLEAKIRLAEIAREKDKRPLQLLRTVIFPEALILVIDNIHRARPIRLGKKWITERGGKWIKSRNDKKKASKPVDLPWHELMSWVKSETCKAASAIIMGTEYPALAHNPLTSIDEDSTSLDQYGGGGSKQNESPQLTSLLAQEKYLQVASALTRRQKEFLTCLEEGKNPAEMGFSANNIRLLLHEIRKKNLSISSK